MGSAPASYAYTYDAVGNRLTQNANGMLTIIVSSPP